jgi:hypothetical protein
MQSEVLANKAMLMQVKYVNLQVRYGRAVRDASKEGRAPPDTGHLLVVAYQVLAEQSEILAKKAVYHQMHITYLQLQACR